ncbi:hypothetical protein [Labrenzia sp. R5_0]|jgi:hypothetical protein|uniref:hypothetical protein n=1 Tax=Labrenzia sp. R5_0 TaxID=2821108 RepID=UPI001ADBF8E1|nr:hypothetical protein [Labrenzia sp. R5_0]MBO9461707.1 hypothetical protein [Labrenzia sp. R5_0]
MKRRKFRKREHRAIDSQGDQPEKDKPVARSLEQMLAECDLKAPLVFDSEDRLFLDSLAVGRELL